MPKKQSKSVEEPQVIVKLQARPDEPQTVISAEPMLIYNIAVLLNALFQMKIEPTQAGYIPKRIAKKIIPLLTMPPYEENEITRYLDENALAEDYINRLYAILHKMELIAFEEDAFKEGKVHLIPGPQYATWAQWDFTYQIHEMLAQWQRGTYVNALSHVNMIYTQQPKEYSAYYNDYNYISGYGSDLLQAQNKHKFFLLALKDCQYTTWYKLDDLMRKIWSVESAERLQAFHYQQKPSKKYDDWLMYYGKTYIEVLLGFVSDLGLIDLGYDEISQDMGIPLHACSIRMTPLAEQLARTSQAIQERQVTRQVKGPRVKEAVAPARTPESDGHYVIQPNFDIMLLTPNMPLIYQLLPFTQVKRIHQASTLQLTRTSIQRGLESGMTIEQIITILTEHSRIEIAQNVLYSIRDWSSQFKIAQASSGYIVEFPDEETAERSMRNTTIAKIAPRQLTSRIFFVSNLAAVLALKTKLDQDGIQLMYHQ